VAAVPSIGPARDFERTPTREARLTEDLYGRHERRVFGFCLYQLRDRDDAADAVQTTFLYALGALRRGVVPSFEAPWLMAIARNVCRSRWDAGKRRREVEFAHDPHRLAELAPGRENTDVLLGIEDALSVLPDPQRRAVLLRDWQGLSYQEVADELDVSISAAETLIFRGRENLARALEGELVGDAPRKRSFGLSSLLSALNPGVFGGSIAVKVAVGTAVVGLGVTGGAMLQHHDAAPPSVTTDSNRPAVSPTAVHSGTASKPSRNRSSSTSHPLDPSRPTAARTRARGGVNGVASTPTETPALGGPVVEPTGTGTTAPAPDPRAPGIQAAGSPTAVVGAQPSSSSAAPLPPAVQTPDRVVPNVPATVAPVVATTADTAQAVVTTVVTTATPVVQAVAGALPAVPPVTVTVPVAPAAPLAPIHLP
jgi:RNA polymerase sigma factor (sigma-70 family)